MDFLNRASSRRGPIGYLATAWQRFWHGKSDDEQ
jgi:hypothetical protein